MVPKHEKAAWTVNEWLDEGLVSRTKFYEEVRAGRIRILKCGRKSLVTTKPMEWLASLENVAA